MSNHNDQPDEEHNQLNVKNFSVDSLEEGDEEEKELSAPPAPTDTITPTTTTTTTTNVDVEPSNTPPNSNDQQKPFAPDGDIASNRSDITREVEQYSEDLARELINSVKQGGK